MWVTKQLTVAIDFHGMKKMLCYTIQWLPRTVWFPKIFKISSFVFNKEKLPLMLQLFTSSVLAPDLLPVYFTSVFSTVHHWFYANDTLLVKYDLQSK